MNLEEKMEALELNDEDLSNVSGGRAASNLLYKGNGQAASNLVMKGTDVGTVSNLLDKENTGGVVNVANKNTTANKAKSADAWLKEQQITIV